MDESARSAHTVNRALPPQLAYLTTNHSPPTVYHLPLTHPGRRGQPHWRTFELAPDETKITYQGSKKRHADLAGYTIASMRSIKLGQHSNSFQRSTLHQLENVSMTIRYCFSFICTF